MMYGGLHCHQRAVNQSEGTVGRVVYLTVTHLRRDISGLRPHWTANDICPADGVAH